MRSMGTDMQGIALGSHTGLQTIQGGLCRETVTFLFYHSKHLEYKFTILVFSQCIFRDVNIVTGAHSFYHCFLEA